MRILLTCGKLSVGGIQKALLAFANELAENGQQVTVLLDDLSGVLTETLHPGIRVEQLGKRALAVHTCRLSDKKKLLAAMAKHPGFGLALAGRLLKKGRSISGKEIAQMLWQYEKKAVPDHPEMFDYAISFAGLMGIWDAYVMDKVKARQKLCWIHGNFQTAATHTAQELEYLKGFDTLVTVTQTNTRLVQQAVGDAVKVVTIHNTVDVASILERAQVPICLEKTGFTMVTMSRLNLKKGIEQGLEAAAILQQHGVDFTWYILGDGPKKEAYIRMAEALELTQVHFLGNLENPYPYVALADVYFHPSLGEGRSIAIDEAMILCKPVIVTNYPTVYDQVQDGKNGLITLPEPGSIAAAVEQLYGAEALRRDMQRYLLQNRSLYDGFNIYRSFMELAGEEQHDQKTV